MTMTRYTFQHTLSCLVKGQTLYRIGMNVALSKYTLRGHTVDIGGGHSPDYYQYFQKTADFTLSSVDGSTTGIDFEKDPLPFADHSVDTIILCNVLEHVYHYRHLVAEARRILKNGGELIGCVPFQHQYHPDPHDYFRYSHEALKLIFSEAGFTTTSISQIEGGTIMANFNNIVLSLPTVIKPLAYVWYRLLDNLFQFLRPKNVERSPLGYIFVCR